MAVFTDGSLDECLDFSGDTKLLGLVMDAMEKAGGKNAKRLPETCAAAFGDRVVMATCTATMDLAKAKAPGGKDLDLGCDPKSAKGCEVDLSAPKSMPVDVAEYHYLFDKVFEADGMLKSCLDMNGKWQALSRDSDAYKDAKRDAARKKLEKLSKQLGQ